MNIKTILRIIGYILLLIAKGLDEDEIVVKASSKFGVSSDSIRNIFP